MIEVTIDLNDLTDKFDSWIENQKQLEKADSTLYGYKISFKNFLDYLSNAGIAEINKDTVINYKQHLLSLKDKGDMKISSINQRLITLNKFFKETGLKDLAVKTERKQRNNSNNDTITESDYKRLIRWADKLGMTREKLIMRTLAETGIRVSELKFFTIENLKKEKTNKSIEVKNKGKTRNIFISNELKKALLNYAEKNDITEGIIFHGRDKDKLLNKSQIWRNLKYIAGRARVKKSKVYSHSFRKLFAKVYVNNYGKENILDLADMLGHASLETTRNYTRGSNLDYKNKVTVMNKEIRFYL